MGPFDFTRATLLDAHGVDALVVDCAHGHNMKVVEAVKNIKGSVNADVIAGNIATVAAAEARSKCGCRWRQGGHRSGLHLYDPDCRGYWCSQITAIAQVAEIASPADVPVIADGGVRYSGDVAKAIAAGADTVMMGSMFAGTDEAPGKVITIKGRRYKQYRGMGSLGVMSQDSRATGTSRKKRSEEQNSCRKVSRGLLPMSGASGKSFTSLWVA